MVDAMDAITISDGWQNYGGTGIGSSTYLPWLYARQMSTMPKSGRVIYNIVDAMG